MFYDDFAAARKDSLCVRRGNKYYFCNEPESAAADFVLTYGKSSDQVICGDWNGDGRDTLAVLLTPQQAA